MLNLPGTSGYDPTRAWLTKQQADNSMASDLVCFLDNKRIIGEGQERVEEAGHALSTRESYLGIQDALQKLRSLRGQSVQELGQGSMFL